MIVIAIIGILAAIAIPNFIQYRNKSFCSAAESDANSIAGALGDYFAIPTITQVPAQAGVTAVDFSREGITVLTRTSNKNTAAIVSATLDPNDGITIRVSDVSGRCPDDYQLAMDSVRDPVGFWLGTSNVYYKIITSTR
jgi:Tfp pilus assembly protein PilE